MISPTQFEVRSVNTHRLRLDKILWLGLLMGWTAPSPSIAQSPVQVSFTADIRSPVKYLPEAVKAGGAFRATVIYDATGPQKGSASGAPFGGRMEFGQDILIGDRSFWEPAESCPTTPCYVIGFSKFDGTRQIEFYLFLVFDQALPGGQVPPRELLAQPIDAECFIVATSRNGNNSFAWGKVDPASISFHTPPPQTHDPGRHGSVGGQGEVETADDEEQLRRR